jgi:phage baseplate assembly protein W
MSFQDLAVPLPSVQTLNVVWLDVNSRMGESLKPDLLPDVQAINNSLYNLLRCPIGARGPIFQPEYGTLLYRLLHEPLDPITANKIRISFIQAIQRWEPRIDIDMERTSVVPSYAQASFTVTVYYTIAADAQEGVATFSLSR